MAPLYDFECPVCGNIQEQFYNINDCPGTVQCSECGNDAHKIIVHGHGTIQCDSIVDVPWLPSALKVLQPDGEKPLQTRGEYKQYLKEKNIIAAG